MLGISFSELLVIAIILLVFVGPKRLPFLMKTGGRALREVRKASTEFRKTVGIDAILADDDIKSIRENRPLAPASRTPPPYTVSASANDDDAEIAGEQKAPQQAAAVPAPSDELKPSALTPPEPSANDSEPKP